MLEDEIANYGVFKRTKDNEENSIFLSTNIEESESFYNKKIKDIQDFYKDKPIDFNYEIILKDIENDKVLRKFSYKSIL